MLHAHHVVSTAVQAGQHVFGPFYAAGPENVRAALAVGGILPPQQRLVCTAVYYLENLQNRLVTDLRLN